MMGCSREQGRQSEPSQICDGYSPGCQERALRDFQFGHERIERGPHPAAHTLRFDLGAAFAVVLNNPGAQIGHVLVQSRVGNCDGSVVGVIGHMSLQNLTANDVCQEAQ